MTVAGNKSKQASQLKDLLFARQPIFDSKKKLYAYELLYRDKDPNSAIFDDGDKATSALIVNYCGSILNEEEGPYVKIFINLTRNLLLSDYFFPLDPNRIVIEILEDIHVDERLVQRIKELKQQGYLFALDDYSFSRKFDPILPHVDYIKFELLNIPPQKLTIKMKEFETNQLSKIKNRPILLAEEVEDQESYDLCSKLGFELFQGYFLEKPVPIYGKKIDNDSETALQIVNQLQKKDIDIQTISHSISRDAKLSYQILKIVNSPLCRLPKKVSSLDEAVIFLGLEQIKKWVMAIVLSGNSSQSKALFLLLVIRARTCELVAEHFNYERPECFFTVGLFSGIDAVMLAEKKWLLEKLDLSSELTAALLELKGAQGQTLKLVTALEHQNFDELASLKSDTLYAYYQSHEEAITWANQLSNII